MNAATLHPLARDLPEATKEKPRGAFPVLDATS